MIQESLETMDEMLQASQKRRQHWVIEAHETKQLVTSLGTVTFKKTLFKNKSTGKCEYLLDRILGLEKHERITEDALSRMLNEAVQTSYRRGGEETSLTTDVKKQTVKNKIHELEFPKNTKKLSEKKKVEYLYIEADEDHTALQFREKKVIWKTLKITVKTTVCLQNWCMFMRELSGKPQKASGTDLLIRIIFAEPVIVRKMKNSGTTSMNI